MSEGQLSFDLGDIVAPAKPKRRRRLQPWEIERGKLKAWQAEQRRADLGKPWEIAVDWPHFDASRRKLSLILRVEREARRCGCETPYPLP